MKKSGISYLPWNPGFDTFGQASRQYLLAKNDPLAEQLCMCYEIKDCGKQPFLVAIPDGCHDIIIACEKEQIKTFVSVSIEAPRLFDFGKSSHIFGIRFLPGASALQKEALSQFLDCPAPLEALFPKNDSFAEKMLSASDFAEQKAILQGFLAKQMQPETEKHRLLRYCVEKIIENNGQYSLEQLAAHTGYSQRYLHTLFKRYIGTAPKTFEKIIRMQYAAVLLRQGQPLSEVALESGYADQSHMNRDFVRLTTRTPRQLRQSSVPSFSAASAKITKFV